MGSDLSPERPRAIGKYLLIATIGSGGMAEVFLAVAKGPAGFNKLLVTKVLRSMLEDDDTFRAMFLDEARLAARMNHPNIPQTYEVGESHGHHFLTMEYLEGQPLHRVTTKLKETFPIELRIRVLTLVLAGLHYAHELTDYDGTLLEVVHRDISPHNVFVTYDGQVKLMDFGIAKVANASTQTATGVIKGKISYMAPEQATAQQPVDRRADIFSVGVMLWEAIAGKRMNADDESEVATLQRRVSTQVGSPLTANPNAPQELVDICMRAVAFDAKDRYATAAEMQEALEHYLEKNALAAKPRDLGKLVTDAFGASRERIRGAIERQLTAAAAESNITLVDLGRDGTGSRSGVVAEEAGSTSSSGVGPMASATHAPLATPGKPGSATPKLVAVGAITIAAIGLFAAVLARGADKHAVAGQVNGPMAEPSAPASASASAPGAASPGQMIDPTGAGSATAAAAPSSSGSAAASGSPDPNAAASAAVAPTITRPAASSILQNTPHPRPPKGQHPGRTVDDKDPYSQ